MKEGEPCTEHEQCEDRHTCIDGYCTGRRLVNIGEPCDGLEDVVCLGGFCDDDRCVPWALEGEPCRFLGHCAIGFTCHEGLCARLSAVTCGDSNE